MLTQCKHYSLCPFTGQRFVYSVVPPYICEQSTMFYYALLLLLLLLLQLFNSHKHNPLTRTVRCAHRTHLTHHIHTPHILTHTLHTLPAGSIHTYIYTWAHQQTYVHMHMYQCVRAHIIMPLFYLYWPCICLPSRLSIYKL